MSKLASNVLIRIVTVRRKIHSRTDSADGLEIIYIITWKQGRPNFMCREIMKHDFGELVVAFSRGFGDKREVQSTNPYSDIIPAIMARETKFCLLAMHHSSEWIACLFIYLLVWFVNVTVRNHAGHRPPTRCDFNFAFIMRVATIFATICINDQSLCIYC